MKNISCIAFLQVKAESEQNVMFQRINRSASSNQKQVDGGTVLVLVFIEQHFRLKECINIFIEV